MHFVIMCQDKPGQAETRAAHREAHFAHLDHYADYIIEAGPLMAEDGSHSVGSLLIVNFEDRSSAEKFIQADPFHKAGIFEAVLLRPYKKILPRK